MNMIEWDGHLVDSIARRRVILFIGSGVSRNSKNAQGMRPSSWEDFLKSCNSKLGKIPHIEDLISTKNYLLACQLIKTRMGGNNFAAEVQRQYQSPGFFPAEIHKHIFDLDSSITISPNFDSIYDNYCQQITNGTYVIRQYSDDDISNYLLGGKTRLLIKSHGAANNPAMVIFTGEDYARARIKYSYFYDILKSLALTHVFLFIGCGLDDPDIKTLFEDLSFTHARMAQHYMTIPKEEAHQDLLNEIGRTTGLKHITYLSNDSHTILTRSLADLAIKVTEMRDEISENKLW